jgi:hypothetical protein
MSDQTIILRHHSIWEECLQLDLITGEKKELVRVNQDDFPYQGDYEIKGDDLIMLYRKVGSLYFSVNDKETCLDDPNVTVSFVREDPNNTFTLKNKEKIVYQITYPSYRFDPVNMADFEFDDFMEEDQDIFLFIYRLLNHPRRRRVMYTPYFD